MKNILKLFSLKFVSSLLGICYSILQVRYFGTSRAIEVFFVAQNLVYLVTSLTQSGQLSEIFLPEYLRLKKIDIKLSFSALNVIINRFFIFSSIALLIIFALTPWLTKLMVPGYGLEDQELVTLIFRILLPYLLLQVINSFFKTVLNAEKKFGRAEALGFVNTIINILFLIFLYDYIGVWSLVVSALLGRFIEFLVYLWQLYKIGYIYQFRLKIEMFDHAIFFKTMRSTFIYVLATQFYNIILTSSISFLPEGVYAIFKYVQNLVGKIRGLSIQPFITIFFTEFNANTKDKSIPEKFYSSLIGVNTLIFIGSILGGNYIIYTLWGNDKFGEESIYMAYCFLIFNMCGILFSSLGSVYRKMVVSIGHAKLLYNFWSVSQFITAGVTYFLLSKFQLEGLFWIIPINAFLMGLCSYLVYRMKSNSWSYNYFNLNSLWLLLIIITSVIMKYMLGFSNDIYDFSEVGLFVGIFTLLGIYPVYRIYHSFKARK